MFLSLCSVFAPFVLAAAPQGLQSPHLARARNPRESVHIDLATGVITRGARMTARPASTISDFPNLDLGGFVGVDSGNGVSEWFNDGVKGVNGNASDLMSSFVFAYCSAKKDVSLGGPGGKVKLGFYEGYTRGGNASGAPNGTAVAVMTLTGLPANSSSSSFFGGFDCFFAEVDLGRPVSFADGPIGYSWLYADVGADGVLAGTWPFLSTAGSCTGTTPVPGDPLGQDPYTCCSFAPADVYSPPGQLHVVVTFAPYCFPHSMAMDIREKADAAPPTARPGMPPLIATAIPFVGDGVNRDVLTASRAVVGEVWSTQVTLGDSHGSSGMIAVFMHPSAANGPNFRSPVGGRPMELLVAGPRMALLPSTHNGTVSVPIVASIPSKVSLVGRPWAAQALVTGGGFFDLTSCVFGVTGTE